MDPKRRFIIEIVTSNQCRIGSRDDPKEAIPRVATFYLGIDLVL